LSTKAELFRPIPPAKRSSKPIVQVAKHAC
jgi:hypothetical protein